MARHLLARAEWLYAELQTLDYCDDLEAKLESRPDLVNLLSDGALAGYMRPMLAMTAASGIDPLAAASDVVQDSASAAAHAVQTGATDPNFAYGYAGREAGVGDEEHGDRRMAFVWPNQSRRSESAAAGHAIAYARIQKARHRFRT